MTTVNSNDGGVKPVPRVQVVAGDNLQDIDKIGSQGQKVAKTWFSNCDYSSDPLEQQTFSEREALLFNDYRIASRPGQINLYNQNDGSEIEIKYDKNSLKDLQDVKRFLNRINNHEIEMNWGSYQKAGKDCTSKHVGFIGNYTKLSLDTVNNTLTIVGGEGNIYGHGLEKAVFKDSSMELIKVDAKTIELHNVKKEGLFKFLDQETQVITPRGNQVKHDEASKVDIEYTKDK